MTKHLICSRFGEGYVREVRDGRPIITAAVSEAQQFVSRADAERVVAELAAVKGLVPLVVVEVEVDGPQRPHYMP